jgi:indolepyruvate ferredoxin oxidoreductase
MSKAVAITLADKYRLDGTRALVNGRQALVRLPVVQRELDRRRGLDTAGLISGYRGSPLGSYDQELWRASATLKENHIVFQPGLNEDLALTALAGAHRSKSSRTSRRSLIRNGAVWRSVSG